MQRDIYQSAIINELLTVYDKLSEDLKAELPLKRIWTLNIPEDEVLEGDWLKMYVNQEKAIQTVMEQAKLLADNLII